MSQLPAEQAIQRFKENEERVDKFVNQPGTYQTNTTPPANVETLSSFIERKDQEITNRYAAMNNRGNWVTGTGYNPLDLYVYSGVVYLVLLAHTSTTVAADVAASKAQVFQGVTPLSLETALNNERSRFGRVGYNSLPRLIQRMKDYLSAPSSPLTVVGFGSSVVVGTTSPISEHDYQIGGYTEKWESGVKDCVVLHSYFTSDYYQLYSTQLSTDTGVEHVTFFIYNKIVDEPEEHVQIHTIDGSSGVVNPVMEPIYDEPTTTTSVPL